jgi:ubiquinone/menaquinone biosynthesis C-methylase UbiE
VLNHYHGGAMSFNDPARRQWQDPEAILKDIGVKTGITFADIGCGGGFFALPAARMVGKEGKVYGVDANPASIASLQKQAAAEGLKNLFPTHGLAEDTVLCRQCADIVFFGMALHDFKDPALVLKNVRLTIKPNGKLINLDWKKDASFFGPPVHIRFDVAKASGLIEDAGFTIESVKDSGRYHYIITAKPHPSEAS